MKITLELEVGPETGVVAGALEQQLKTFEAIKEMGRPVPMLQATTQRILTELEEKVEQAAEDAIWNQYP